MKYRIRETSDKFYVELQAPSKLWLVLDINGIHGFLPFQSSFEGEYDYATLELARNAARTFIAKVELIKKKEDDLKNSIYHEV